MNKLSIANWDKLKPLKPKPVLVKNVDLVVIKWEDEQNVSVLFGRCLHRGAMLADGHVSGENLICGVHGWDFQYKTGVSAYDNKEVLHKFSAWIEDGQVWIDADEVKAWGAENPQAYARDSYQGQFADLHGTEDEPHTNYIQHLATHGLNKIGHHGRVAAMGVPLHQLPKWDDIQFVTKQLYEVPLLDDEPVGTNVIIGSQAKKPLKLDIPLFISDMSYGALSEEAKVALAKGAELVGTGICSGEGGMLPEEQAANSRYLYELASGRFGYSMDKVQQCQAFHFKCGQGAKTGTGGHLPGHKVQGKIAQVRHLNEGQDAISPSRFPDWDNIQAYQDFAAEVREATGGIPIGVKLSAQHIEKDIDAAIDIGVDYIILDGRGGGTGAAPLLFRDNISVPTIPALARARRHLDKQEQKHISLIITGGLRLPEDYAKALALGADAVALSNAAIQAIGCLAMRACHTNNCPVGIATQKPDLRARLPVDLAAERLKRFFESSTHLMQVMSRACGHHHLNQFCLDDLTTWKKEMAELSGVDFGGIR